MEKQPLSPRQNDVYQFIVNYFKEHNECPTYLTIGKSVGMLPAQVAANLAVLQYKGYVTKDPEKKRKAIVLVD